MARKFITFFTALSIFPADVCLARKTNQAVYEEPFDIAGGGAALTRATQEGVLFANPAQMPYGSRFFRWLGLKQNLMVNSDSVALAQSVAGGGSASSGESGQSKLIEQALKTPIHLGASSALSFISNNVGFAAFGRFEPDIRASRFGESGLPGVHFSSENYGGGILGLGVRSPLRWLSFGLGAKYLMVSEPDIFFDIAEKEKLTNLSSVGGMQSLISFNTGTGVDAGAMLFFQGSALDLRIALKADDVGGTSLKGKGGTKKFEQTNSAGIGLTLHNTTDALHLSADYRDINSAYGEDQFKRLYFGAKFLIRQRLGFAAGRYQGYPSYGVVLDLFVMRVGFTTYTREMGDHPDVEPRTLYVGTFGLGY